MWDKRPYAYAIDPELASILDKVEHGPSDEENLPDYHHAGCSAGSPVVDKGTLQLDVIHPKDGGMTSPRVLGWATHRWCPACGKKTVEVGIGKPSHIHSIKIL